MADRKIVIFGIDGCPEEIVRKWVLEENKLPNFRKVYEQGAFTSMTTTIPYSTVPGWMSLLTGKKPGKLDLYYFFNRITGQYKTTPVSLAWKTRNPIWDILSENENRSIILNVPSTIPKEADFNGILVSGPVMNPYLECIAYPEQLNKQLLDDGYLVDLNFWVEDITLKHVEKIIKYVRKKIALAESLFKNEKWDLFMFAFYYIDPLLHRFWKYIDTNYIYYEDNEKFKNVIFDFYKIIDEHLGFYLENLPDNSNLYIASDHGMGPRKGFIDLNKWLFNNKFLYLKTERKRKVTLKAFQNSIIYRPLRKMYLSMKGGTFLKKIRNYIWNTLPGDDRSWKDIDWSQSSAYSIGKESIFINLKGREPEGIIDGVQEYNEIVDEIIQKLYELKDPDDGQPVVQKAWKGKELYSDGSFEKLPDIIIEYRNGSYYQSDSREPAPGDKLFTYKEKNSAAHKHNTIFGCYGVDIEAKPDLEGVSIVDVVPTILHNMNIPIPDDIDGKVLLDIFREDSDSKSRKIKYTKVDKKDESSGTKKDDEEKIIMERLKKLGYI